MREPASLRDDALAIWMAAVDRVRSDQLVERAVRVQDRRLHFDRESIELDRVRRIVVVGAGKAGAGMATGLLTALGSSLIEEKQLVGWINVPADCVQPLDRITLHPARPAGVNEPTETGVAGAAEILRLVEQLGPNDLCFCLLSGGGSALLPAPAGITLQDKLAVTKHLSSAGANIQQLNSVRKQLSRIKGGGLAKACRAGRLITLIISDVLGDPLDVIASGPTVPDRSTPDDALRVLQQFDARQAGIPDSVFSYLESRVQGNVPASAPTQPACKVSNLVIGNNATAVDGAIQMAHQLGYEVEFHTADSLEGDVEPIADDLIHITRRYSQQTGRHCFISGGEPTVKLAPADERGLGGRNTHLVLSVYRRLCQPPESALLENLTLLSGGTDGEDGPTDAAGGLIDRQVHARAIEQNLDPGDFLMRSDSYNFLRRTGGLIQTGPTHTNVCDVRVLLVEHQPETAADHG